jgi:hypothetical protein
MTASATYNAMMAGTTQVTTTLGLGATTSSTLSDSLTAESVFREREKQMIASVNPATARAVFQQQALMMAPNALVTASSGSTASFNVAQFNNLNQYTGNLVVNATCQYVGANAYIFVDNNDIAANPATYTANSPQLVAISTAFDAIYAADRATFGSEWGGAAPGNGSGGIDMDSKIYILISRAVNSNGANGYLGYFYGGDEFPTTAIPLSNKHEMFYVVNRTAGALVDLWDDANLPSHPNAAKGYNILAHEFQHMINFNTKYGHNGLYNGVVEDTWLNEALSMYAMQACGYGLTNTTYPDSTTAAHVFNYLQAPHNYSLTTWTAGNYGMSYLFMLYLVEHYSGGGGQPTTAAMLQAMESNSSVGIANVETQTGAGTFGNVFKNWAMANYLDHITTNNTYNYTTINLHSTYVTSGGTYILNGAQPIATPAIPFNATVTQSGWSAMYQQYTNGTGNALNISIQNNSATNYLDGIVVVQ